MRTFIFSLRFQTLLWSTNVAQSLERLTEGGTTNIWSVLGARLTIPSTQDQTEGHHLQPLDISCNGKNGYKRANIRNESITAFQFVKATGHRSWVDRTDCSSLRWMCLCHLESSKGLPIPMDYHRLSDSKCQFCRQIFQFWSNPNRQMIILLVVSHIPSICWYAYSHYPWSHAAGTGVPLGAKHRGQWRLSPNVRAQGTWQKRVAKWVNILCIYTHIHYITWHDMTLHTYQHVDIHVYIFKYIYINDYYAFLRWWSLLVL